jgi:hypothetical protein
MTMYLIYRNGANSANQPMCDQMPVAIVEAASRDAACATDRHDANGPCYLSLDESVTCWRDQHFTAVPWSRAKACDWNAVVESAATGSE